MSTLCAEGGRPAGDFKAESHPEDPWEQSGAISELLGLITHLNTPGRSGLVSTIESLFRRS